jgi:hypothetical protein
MRHGSKVSQTFLAFASFFSNSLFPSVSGRLPARNVRDLQGRVIADRMVCHAYSFEDGLIKSMEIKKPAGA